MVEVDHRDEIVDDSEPEREEWRQQRKKSNPKAIPNKPAVTRQVIELTDDESEGGYLHSIKSTDVIDISGSASYWTTSFDF
jgi:hypothetical protein